MVVRRGPYKPKPLKFEHTCRQCGLTYKSADVKGAYCVECKKPKPCICGCGKLSSTPGRLLARGCGTRGKSYEEIYTSSSPSNGFKKGLLNPMANEGSKVRQREGLLRSYTPELLEKRREAKLSQIDQGLIYGKMRYTNSKGEKFRSILEYNFCNFLIEKGIPYEYEPKAYILPENSLGYKRKVVDFRIKGCIVEITGLAYQGWLDQFIYKINLLKQVTQDPILILTYPNRISKIMFLEDQRTKVLSIEDLSESFIQNLNKYKNE